MISKAKYIFLIFGLSLVILACSENSIISGNGAGQRDNKTVSPTLKCDTINCNYHNNMRDANPDYVPPDCGKCNGKWNNYRHRGLMNGRECYFGKDIKK